MRILITIVLLLSGSVAFAQRDTNTHEIPWQAIKKEDILWKKRVWREIAVYEKQNAPLRYDPISPQEAVFANVLLSGITADLFNAFAADTENNELLFHETANNKSEPKKEEGMWVYTDESDSLLPALGIKHPLTKEDVKSIIACDPAQLSIYSRKYINFRLQHPNDTVAFTIEEYEVKERRKKRTEKRIVSQDFSIYDTTPLTSCIYPQQIDHYGIIEDWIFDRNQGQMVVRIEAIAPMVNDRPLFWLSYPDIRKYIVQYDIYAGSKDMKMNWDEYFESRLFSSMITRVSGPTSSPDH